MKGSVTKWVVVAVAVLAVAIGCSSVLTDVTGSSGGTGFANVGSGFSDSTGAGGTGTTTDTTTDPATGDVELPAEETRSFFTAFQIDPVEEDTAGAKFVVAGDIDQDGLIDLVSAWNQSQPIQLHLQRRDASGTISFRTITLAGTFPVAVIAGVELGQINGDGWLDVIVLVKATGAVGLCPTSPPGIISELEGEVIVYFNPAAATAITDGDQWSQMILVNPYVQDRWIHNQFPGNQWADFDTSKDKPENSGFTALVVGEIDGNPGDEIVVALNPGSCKELDQDPPTNTVDLWINPGGTLAEVSQNWGAPPDIALSRGVPVSIMLDAPFLTDIELSDIDSDGDLDVVAVYSDSISLNVRWSRNPLIPSGFAEVIRGGSNGDVDRCAGGPSDGTACPNGDVDCAGTPPGVCMANICVGGANPGGACTTNNNCLGTSSGNCAPTSWRYIAQGWQERPVGQIDTNANVIDIGDIDGDGFDDIVVRSTPGQLVQWFRRPTGVAVSPEFPPSDPVPGRTNFPWQVYTLTEFADQEPEAIALGDITGNGSLELLVAVQGGVFWYDSTVGASVFDPWFGSTIIQDDPDATAGTGLEAPGGTGVGVGGLDDTTVINTLLVVDLDGDGRNDIVGTLDRRAGSGLSDDRLVWYRNTKSD